MADSSRLGPALAALSAITAPVGGEAATGFRYDPLDPTPSVGGRISSYHGGSRDNTAVEARADVLTFSTAPPAGPVHVAGVPSVRVHVSHHGACADIVTRLCDVDGRGRSRDLTDQIIRLGRPGRRMAASVTVTALRRGRLLGERR
jgi:uncharacterized protein